jgi:hypothetical protein
MPTPRPSTGREVHRLRGPGELIQAVPYLLGFHPRHSLVLVGLDGGCITITARLDLADAATPGTVEHTLHALRGAGSTALVAMVYEDDARAADSASRAAAETLADVVEDAGEAVECTVLDSLLVAAGRWWSLRCQVEECCPASGRPIPDAPSAFAAAATYSGVVAMPDREAVAAALDPLPAAERARLDESLSVAEDTAVQAALDGRRRAWLRRLKRDLFAAARSCEDPKWSRADDADAARFAVALGETEIRDAVWLAVDDGRLDGRPLWRDLARRLPSPYDAAPLVLFGWAAWRAGDGTTSRMAAERALLSDPGYTAADLLLAAVSCAVDPRTFPKLRGKSA